MRRVTAALFVGKKDFDSWAYDITWPEQSSGNAARHPSSSLRLVMEDVKFAYNAWCFMRLALFLGLSPPRVVSSLARTTPSMDIHARGNHIFHANAVCNYDLRQSDAYKVALVPCGDGVRSMHDFTWTSPCRIAASAPDGHDAKASCPQVCGRLDAETCLVDGSGAASSSQPRTIEIVAGMENGMSDNILSQCDEAVYIPQYGSIGSLSVVSALAIAAHCAVTHRPTTTRTSLAKSSRSRLVCGGHMPESRSPPVASRVSSSAGVCLPHEASLLTLGNDVIRFILAERRKSYSLQIGLAVYNDLGDRNIGALMRTANAFNCERMVVVNRRRFNRRGALGTHKLLDVVFAASVESTEFVSATSGYAWWILYPYYPYLHMYERAAGSAAQRAASSTPTTRDGGGGKLRQVEKDAFLAADDACLVSWKKTGHVLSRDHVLVQHQPHLHESEIYLDDSDEEEDASSLRRALKDVRRAGYRGVMLIVPEEGASVHHDLASLAHKTLFILHPSRLCCRTQRGLNPALSGAIAVHRLRTAMDQIE